MADGDLVRTISFVVRSGITCYVYIYQYSQDTANNTTTYRTLAKLYCTNNASYHLDDDGIITLKIGGTTLLSATGLDGFDFRGETWQTIYDNHTHSVENDTDGSYSETWTVTVKYDETGSYADGSDSGVVAFDTIPRASAIGTISTFNIEDTFSVPITKYSASFTDTLTIKIGDTVIKTITGYTNGADINLTDDEILTAYAAITALSETFTFTTTTKSGSTTIGTDSATAIGTVAGTAYVKVSGAWKRCVPYVKVSGAWKKSIMYSKVSGAWERGIA